MISRREFLALGALGLSQIASPLRVIAANNDSPWVERRRPMMGTLVSVAIANGALQAQEQIDRTFDIMDQVVSKISCWHSSSDTGILNLKRVLNNPSPEIYSLTEAALHIEQITKGAFNSKSYGLTKLWREARAASSIPSAKDVRREMHRCALSRVSVAAKEMRLLGSGSLEFGGIGKGFVADCAAAFLRSLGLSAARVACSGDLRFTGNTSWIVDIQDPSGSGILGSVEIFGDCAISTSGDYEAAWSVNGKNYHHLLDLSTGYPSNKAHSVTIIAPNCTLADGLSTALFAMNSEEAISLCESLPNIGAIIVSGSGKVFHSRNINFHPKWKV